MPYLGHMSTQPHGVIPTFTLADRLRKARELTGLDQIPFADELGISRNSVSNAETGTVMPRRITLKAWAMRTGVDLDWLLTGTAPTAPDGGGEWAPRGSNPQPTDYGYAQVTRLVFAA